MSVTMPDYDRLEQQLIELMGGLPERPPLAAETAQRWTREEHFVEYVTYNGDAGERIPAYLLVPADIDQPRPPPIAIQAGRLAQQPLLHLAAGLAHVYHSHEQMG
ncbi:MAG: hypothetical protein KAW89_01850 [Armatimonadetes bacterium]|nr:hypothetical protein [Armatimonadota bacterium]